MKNSAIDSKLAGQRNEKLVIQLLLRSGGLSQSQICRETGLNSSTISYIVGRLREKELIIEKPGKSNKRGAKPVFIEIDPKGLYTIGIEINPSYIIAGLFDFKCGGIDNIKIPLGDDHSPENVVELIEINVKGLVSRNLISAQKLVGIGVTLSGSVSQHGVIKLSSPLGWKNIALKEMLDDKFDCPVEIYTTKVRLLAELMANPSLASENIMYINVGNGVGCTILLDGKLLHGATNRCGELGHIVIDPENGPVCGCGQKGCLEAFISGPSIANLLKKVEKTAPKAAQSLPENAQNTPEKTVKSWKNLLKKGDKFAIEIRDFIADKLSSSIAMALNLYDPDTIILAGYVMDADFDFFAKSIKNKFSTELYDESSRDIKIIPSLVKEQVLSTGVAAAVFQKAFEL